MDSEPEQAIVYVRARGNLSLDEKDALIRRAEEIVLAHPGVQSAFSFAGEGGLDTSGPGGSAPKDAIGQIQLETIPWEDRAAFADARDDLTLAMLDGNTVLDDLSRELEKLPGVQVEVSEQAQGPGQGKPIHLRLQGDDWTQLMQAAGLARAQFDATPGLTLIEDTRPLPGIDWQIDVDVEMAGRYGADVAIVGAMVQLVTRGILLDTMRVDSSDEEIDIRVRFPEDDRLLSTLDTLKVRTADGLVPLSNFITRQPVAKLAEIERVGQKRYFDVKSDVAPGLFKAVQDGETLGTLQELDGEADSPPTTALVAPNGTAFAVFETDNAARLTQAFADETVQIVAINATERTEQITQWLETNPLPAGIEWEWTGDQEEQAESQAFLQSAFGAALGLMFIILLAQFNSFYNSVLVLLAVVLSTTGVLWGMIVMDQYFSIIMTGTGIVALAGIVVNNNIVLIDTYQEYSRFMPRGEAIVRTAEDRIRPVLLTTITTMAGLAPMMFGLSLDFWGGGYSVDSPTALWWKNLATAVVFGLGIATVLTLVVTPSLLAIRVWAVTYVLWIAKALAALSFGRSSKAARDWALNRAARRVQTPTILWDEDDDEEVEDLREPLLPFPPPLRAAE